MADPKVSVLLAAYNTKEEYLRAAIDSVLAQTFPDFELLIVDDASPDRNVEAVVRSYTDPRVKYFLNEQNMGISKTRTKLMQLAHGEYLAVMDHDDLILPEKLARQVSYMDANPDIGICGTAYRRFGKRFKNNVIRHPENDREIRAWLFFKCVMHHPSVMIRRSVIADNNIGYDDKYISANDQKLYLDISRYAGLHNLPDVLSLYRLHNGMTSAKQREKISREQKELRKELFAKLGVSLNEKEIELVNNYVMRGRSRIRSAVIVREIERVLCAFVSANSVSKAFPEPEFSRVCATYLIKRCFNASLWGFVGSRSLLKKTTLPVNDVKIPWLLKLMNCILRG